MTKFKKTKEVEAIQWFPPGEEGHIPVEGMVSLPGHVLSQIGNREDPWRLDWEIKDRWLYWGGRNNYDFDPIYTLVKPGEWIVFRNGTFIEVLDYDPAI